MRAIALACVYFCLTLCGSSDASAQSFAVVDFRDTAGFTYVNIPRVAQVLDLTPNGHLLPMRAALWRRDRVRVDGSWTATVAFQITDTGALDPNGNRGMPDPSGRGGADGLALVIQREGPLAIGGSGYNLGYGGIAGGLAVEVDTWDDTHEPSWGDATEDSADHVAIHSNGRELLSAVPRYSAVHLSRTVGDLSDGFVHTLAVRYTPGLLRVYVDDCTTPVLSLSVWLDDLLGDSLATIGITAATQSAWQRHRLHGFCFAPGAVGCGCSAPCDTVYLPSPPDTVVVRDTVVRRDTATRVDTLRVVEFDTLTVRDTVRRVDTLLKETLRLDTVEVERQLHDTVLVVVELVPDTLVINDTIIVRHIDTLFIHVVRDTCVGITLDSTVCGYQTRTFVYQDSVALAVSPNPATDAVTIAVTAPGPWRLAVVDQRGVPVLEREGSGRAAIIADVSDLPSGVYDVQLVCGHVARDVLFHVIR
jgi:hypothetical protein